MRKKRQFQETRRVQPSAAHIWFKNTLAAACVWTQNIQKLFINHTYFIVLYGVHKLTMVKACSSDSYPYVDLVHICNMHTSGQPDMYTLRPKGRGCTYQVDYECPCYKYHVTPSPTFTLWFSVR